MTRSQTTTDDLLLAADWLETYDGGDDDENGERLAIVAQWLRTEAQRREEAATVRRIAAQATRKHGRKVTAAEARRALASVRAGA